MAESAIRNAGLRAQRESIDTGQGVTRTAGNTQREQHIGRGTFINWYDDLGLATTRPAADQIRQEEAAYNKNISEQEGRISEVKNKLNSAHSELAGQEAQIAGTKLPQLNEAVDKSWGDFRNTLTPVRVVGPGDVVEATYYLPRDVADKLSKQEGIFSAWVGDDKSYFNVMVKGYRNKELHDPLREAANTLESEYKIKAQEAIAAELGLANSQLGAAANQVGAAKNELAGYDAQVASAEGALNAAKQLQKSKWDDIHNKYNERRDKMTAILGSLSVGE